MKGRQAATKVSSSYPSPNNYTPSPSYSESTDRVSAHLKGIDSALGLRPTGPGSTGPQGPTGPSDGPTGPTGVAGTNGINAFTTTTADFLQPNSGENVTISVADTSWMAEGQIIYIADGNYYQVIEVLSPTSVEVKNLDYPGSAIGGTTILHDSLVTPAGMLGPKGDDGDQGPVGPAGSLGSTGPQGPQGNDGVTGPAGGPTGEMGATGAQGPQGEFGGPTGPQGDQGPQGPQGSVGADGVAGPAGAKGDRGPAGPAGPKGDVGAAGAKGDKGDKGDTGLPGAAGPQGFQGDDGPQGDVGATGATGHTPAITADSHWYSSSTGPGYTDVQIFSDGSLIDEFVVYDGPTGPQGTQGPTGPVGPTGPAGSTGLTGPTGAQGVGGMIGPTGASGVGATGPTGPSGSKLAIVQIQNKWLGLYCTEAPQVWFFDIVEAHITKEITEIAIDPKFIEACELDTIRVTAIISDDTGLGYSTIWVEGEKIKLEIDKNIPVDDFSLRVTIFGIRKGCTQRFAEYTEEQAMRNNSFWQSALNK